MNRSMNLMFLLVVFVLGGCGTAPVPAPAPPAPPAGVEEGDYAVVQTFFATDRNLEEGRLGAVGFGGERSDIRYGRCYVSIPRDHRMGELESPSILRLEFRQDPVKHVVLLETELQARDRFFSAIREEVEASSGKKAFVFVHGYNVSFEDAARRSAQMAYDLGFDGAPVFYSWPSRGKPQAYVVDGQNAEWSEANLARFLSAFFQESEAEKVYLIAHSMGGRILSRALISAMQDDPAIGERVEEVIFAAPDIDAQVFAEDIMPRIASRVSPVTLYASSNDLALAASRQVHGGYSRAGDTAKGVVVLDGLETIDASYVETGFNGHSYFADNRSILSDMFYLIGTGARASHRFGLTEVDAEDQVYWQFKR